jgi:molybdopterin adenylyltransferase
MEKAKFGVLTVSDRASRGEYEDISGKYIDRVSPRGGLFAL